METLALQLAELLEISVDKAIELYPVLRTQFVWYKIMGIVNLFSFIISLFSGTVVGFSLIDHKFKDYKNVGVLFIISTIIAVSSSLLKYIFATDLMMILEFL